MHPGKARSGAAIQWFAAVTDLPDDWDTLLPEGHFLKRSSLEAHERARLPHLETIYAGLRREDGAFIAQSAFQVLTLQKEHINAGGLKDWQACLWGLFSRIAQPRLVVAGQLFRHDVSSFYAPASVGPFDAFNYYRQIIRAVLQKKCAHAVLVKEPPEAFVPYFQHYAPDYLLLRNDSSMQLQLPADWASMADYEKSLKHKYAQRFRKVRQSWQSLRVQEMNGTEITAAADRLYDLYLQVTMNQPVRLGLLSKTFIPELKAFYGDKLKVWGVWEGDALIAFASAWVQADSFDMFYIGFDYQRNTELQLYFNILFFSIEQAILLRKPRLILGRTALEAKARVGCRPVYLHTFLYIRNPLLRNIVGRLQQRFSEGGGEWENRHPFKKEPE